MKPYGFLHMLLALVLMIAALSNSLPPGVGRLLVFVWGFSSITIGAHRRLSGMTD
ncbi:MAG TPA: hypothetical protein P5056_02010 [Candidatus Paceibacterota bacterium]|nr:hypothetical protein [Candidatus Paceibacterota bacterium]